MRPAEEQIAILERGTVHLVERAELRERLCEGRPLRVKVGFDPTAPDLHLGHTVLMHKMRQWQDLGHEVIFVIGDFTATIGDPSGRSAARPPLSRAEVLAHAETYKEQAFKVLDPARTRWETNSTWIEALGVAGLIELAQKYTVARTIERNDFRERLAAGQDVGVHEFLYPLLQGYDSVALRADVELGGSDQLFNLMVGRDLQRRFGQRPQVVLTVPLLEGIDGAEKMSKTAGNHVGLDMPAREIFGRTMRISDELMWRWYDLLSLSPPAERDALRAEVAAGRVHPREAKARLGEELAARFSSPAEALAAREEFDRVFRDRGLPDEIPEARVAARGDSVGLHLALKEAGLAPSTSEALRLCRGGGVTVDGERVTDGRRALAPGSYLVRVGKRRVCRLTVTTQGAP